MPIRIAINGFGRIGRNVLRAIIERNLSDDLQVVTINDLAQAEHSAHLLKYDSAHGKLNAQVETTANEIKVNSQTIRYISEPDLTKLPWAEHDIDIVFECTGHFANRQEAEKHLQSGAKKVLISAPAGPEVDATIVYGVNHQTLKAEHKIVSNASCTTNCLATISKVINDNIGIDNGLMTTIHAYTNDQRLTDTHHSDLHRARAAAISMIPTKTGVAKAIGLVLPELDGKLQGYSLRVPTVNVSVVDFTFTTKQATDKERLNALIKEASTSNFKDIIAYNDEPLVSIDFNHNSASAVYDATQTLVSGNLVKLLAWYDNEWGFSNRMLDTTKQMFNCQ